MVIVEDESEEARAKEEPAQQAFYDTLTDLPTEPCSSTGSATGWRAATATTPTSPCCSWTSTG